MKEYRFRLYDENHDFKEVVKVCNTDEDAYHYAEYLIKKYKCKSIKIEIAIKAWFYLVEISS